MNRNAKIAVYVAIVFILALVGYSFFTSPASTPVDSAQPTSAQPAKGHPVHHARRTQHAFRDASAGRVVSGRRT